MSKFNFAAKARMLKKAMPKIAETIAEETRKHYLDMFDSAQYEGKAWAPLKKATIEWKNKYSKINKPLQNSGDLRTAIENSIKDRKRNSFVWFIDCFYATYQNDGTYKGGTARQFIPTEQQFKAFLDELYKKEIAEVRAILNKKL